MNNKYQFEDEVLDKYNRDVYDAAQESFNMLPLCSIIDKRTYFLAICSPKTEPNVIIKLFCIAVSIGSNSASSAI